MARVGIIIALLVFSLDAAGCTDVRSMRRSRDVEGLVHLLESSDPQTRVKAVDALGYVGDSRAVRPLIKMLRDPDAYVREHAARNLGCDYHSSLGCDTGEPVEALIAVLNDDDYFVRVEAARSLGEHPLPIARAPLERLARTDPHWEVRHAAAFALGRIGSSESVPVLEALLADDEEQVVLMAREALRRTASVRARGRGRDRRLDVEIDVVAHGDRGADAGVDPDAGHGHGDGSVE